MSDIRFPILGTEIPLMLGRTKIMQRLWSDLTKPTPSNLSIVGPRFAGKTVIMNALAQKAEGADSPYAFVLYWHLGHITPASDSEFISQLCDLLRDKLSVANADYSEHCEYLRKHTFSHFLEVTDLLNADDSAILMIWDGFDKPLAKGNLSGNLWDQMRSIFYGKKHKIVTATRRPLSELIRGEDAITSPFWNVFDMNPVRVEAFDEQDRESIIAEISSYCFESGAKTELNNWSSGVPILFLGILNQVVVETSSGCVDNETVNRAAKKALECLSNYISELWQDCPASAKELYSHLVERGEELFANAGKDERNCLLEKNFARQTGNKLVASCRMLKEHVQGAVQDIGSMARLFGTWEDYRGNIRGLLERRLSHISRFDERLCRLVERVIADIPDYPDDCLSNLTGIRDRALKLIWQCEFGASATIPDNVIAYWTTSPRSNNKLVDTMMQSDCWTIPTDPLEQIRLLGLLTGSVRSFDAKAKAISKDTYVLMNAIHNFRNRVEHSDGQSMHLGVAVAAIITCLELLSCLQRELA